MKADKYGRSQPKYVEISQQDAEMLVEDSSSYEDAKAMGVSMTHHAALKEPSLGFALYKVAENQLLLLISSNYDTAGYDEKT